MKDDEKLEMDSNKITMQNELTPKDYDRWGRTCIRFTNDESAKQATNPIDISPKKETTLKRVRCAKGFTQKSLSEATGISLRTIQHWEQGNIDFNQAAAMTVYEVSQALEVDMLDLLDIPESKEVKTIQAVDVETEYFPEDLRKKYKLGEYAED